MTRMSDDDGIVQGYETSRGWDRDRDKEDGKVSRRGGTFIMWDTFNCR